MSTSRRAKIERRLAIAHWRITEPALGLRFAEAGSETPVETLRHEGRRILPMADFADEALAEYVYLLRQPESAADTPVQTQEVQKLVVPRDYAELLSEYHERMAAFGQVEHDFLRALATVDEAVYAAFQITAEEQKYIAARLSRFPLHRLQPRYPWQAVRSRPIKA